MSQDCTKAISLFSRPLCATWQSLGADGFVHQVGDQHVPALDVGPPTSHEVCAGSNLVIVIESPSPATTPPWTGSRDGAAHANAGMGGVGSSLVEDIVYAIITRVRVVVDTNVLVAAACSSTGASREVVRRCLLGRCEPLIGQALFTEYEAVLSRSDLFSGSPISSVERYVLWAAFVSRCRWVRVRYLWRPNLPDEADNHVVELAAAGGAESNRDFQQARF